MAISQYWTKVFKDAIKAYLKTEPNYTIKNYDHSYFWPFRASGIGHCLMSTYLASIHHESGPKEVFSAKQLLTFQQGHWFELILLEALKMAGLLTNQDMTIQLTMGGVTVTGHADGEVKKDFLLEVKTSGDWAFNQIKGGEALDSHKIQAGIYAHALKKPAILYCYFQKAKGALLVIQQDYDPAHLLNAENRVIELHTALVCKKHPTPERSFLCRDFCFWRDKCFAMTGDPLPLGSKTKSLAPRRTRARRQR